MRKSLFYAFKKSLPVLVGYLFLGSALGVMMYEAGYNALWAMGASIFVYAGSGEFLLVSLLTSSASLATVAIMTLLINSRHIFYGLSFLKRFKKSGKAYPYMIFSLTDETYSVLCALDFYPRYVDEGQVNFFIALFDHIYWIAGSVLGALLGQLIPIDFSGIEFAMTALFIVLLVEQFKNNKSHLQIYIGAVSALVFLFILGPDNFILPSLGVTVGVLLALQNFLKREVNK